MGMRMRNRGEYILQKIKGGINEALLLIVQSVILISPWLENLSGFSISLKAYSTILAWSDNGTDHEFKSWKSRATFDSLQKILLVFSPTFSSFAKPRCIQLGHHDNTFCLMRNSRNLWFLPWRYAHQKADLKTSHTFLPLGEFTSHFISESGWTRGSASITVKGTSLGLLPQPMLLWRLETKIKYNLGIHLYLILTSSKRPPTTRIHFELFM